MYSHVDSHSSCCPMFLHVDSCVWMFTPMFSWWQKWSSCSQLCAHTHNLICKFTLLLRDIDPHVNRCVLMLTASSPHFILTFNCAIMLMVVPNVRSSLMHLDRKRTKDSCTNVTVWFCSHYHSLYDTRNVIAEK